MISHKSIPGKAWFRLSRNGSLGAVLLLVLAARAHAMPNYDDSGWQHVTLPHDWAIAGPFTRDGGGGMGRLPSGGVGWYRKKLILPASDAGKCFFLDVDGAMSYAAVWINGKLAGG